MSDTEENINKTSNIINSILESKKLSRWLDQQCKSIRKTDGNQQMTSIIKKLVKRHPTH